MHTIRILVADESPALTQTMSLSLRRRSGFEVIGPVPDAPSALEVCAEACPDLVVVNLDRNDHQGIAIVSAVRNGSSIRVMTATRHPGAPLMELALAAGACGVLPSDHGPSSLVNAFHRALAGQLVLPADGPSPIVDDLRAGRARMVQLSLLETLTGREREVLTALAEGATTPGIALELGISPATVQAHVKNIFGKLHVHSKVEAIGAAWRGGLSLVPRSA
ncbi:MAG: LuxR C-terminal-related transcriptional regulator [Actinomycetota bacterium]